MNLHFVYVSRSDKYKESLKDELPYIYQMSNFYGWWLREKFTLYYKVSVDVLVVEKAHLLQFRFGMNDLIKHHKEKGEGNYHFYISYFKPIWTDCSAGFFTDNMGLIQWKEYSGKVEKHRFFALENCAMVSHVLLHEIGRQKHYDNKRFKEEIHDQWDKHLYGADDFEFYDEKLRFVTGKDDFMFATMKIPTHQH
ncbi:MAG: hypothetical protein ACE5KA_06690 [Nitrososphaerales archaeon]